MKNDSGGIDFVQVVVGLIIIAIACIASVKIFSYGWETQDWQMRHKKAISIARSEIEYIQGRINCDFDPNDRDLIIGNEVRADSKLLDDRNTETKLDDIFCKVFHKSLTMIDDPETGNGIDYYKISVTV
jgi:hypothetical protein